VETIPALLKHDVQPSPTVDGRRDKCSGRLLVREVADDT
jgi:hypothetical protein